MDTRASDRRGFFREAMIQLAREVAERTEQRVAPRRYFRPPGAADEIAFLASCTRCGDCMPVCPVHAIIKAPPGAGLAAGTPIIDPAIQACVVCADMPCAHACATGAGERALAMDAGGHPVLRPEGCVGCGVCVTACVTSPSSLKLRLATAV